MGLLVPSQMYQEMEEVHALKWRYAVMAQAEAQEAYCSEFVAVTEGVEKDRVKLQKHLVASVFLHLMLP